MKFKVLNCFALVFTIVLFSYGTANAQVVDKVKEVTKKTKDVTVKTTKKTVKVTKDVAGETKEKTVKGAKKTGDVTSDVYEKSEDGTSKSYKVVKEGFEDADDRGISKEVIEATSNGTKKTVYYAGDKGSDFGKLGYKATKSVVVKSWDGSKWVSKKTYIFVKEESKDF